MRAYVLDASVAASIVLPEVHTVTSRRFIRRHKTFVVPDIVFSEVGNALWKQLRRGDISLHDAWEGLRWLDEFDGDVVETREHVREAFVLSSVIDDSVHDCLYLTIARTLDAPLVTADHRLYDKAVEAGLEDSVIWIEEAA